jgi:hypothetical protein
MIFVTKEGKSFDTEKDLTPPERHILQKLFLWQVMVSSIEEFREKKRDALMKGWNNSGPVEESHALREIIKDLEIRVQERLKNR